jgi:hypothetical protein
LAADQPQAVDGARVSYWVNNNSCSIYFYNNGENISGSFYLEFFYDTQANSTLPVGTYTFDTNRDGSLGEFYSPKGFMGGMGWYGESGTVTVSKENNIYTIDVDMDTSLDSSGNITGKIRGTYTGYLPTE